MSFSLTSLSSALLLIFLSLMPIHASLQEDCSAFVNATLKGLRESRSELKRTSVPFAKTVEILEFIEGQNTKYGIEALTESPQFYDLLVDLCDIVNLQHPDFKTRYDVFVEQWDGNDQKPFSLFSFDRIAQLFHFRDSLFDQGKTSWYRALIADVVRDDLPALKGALSLIRDLDAVHKGLLSATPHLDELNAQLNQLPIKTAGERAAEQKSIRRKSPPPRIKRLYAISAMAHDYLVLKRLAEASNLVLGINQFTVPQEREAFLAGMIQIGELSTNKNLSAFIKSFMPTIPWKDFVHCRDAIEHQDEHDFNTYFRGIVDGTNLSVDFTAWQKEMEILKQRVTDLKQEIWGLNPKAKFEEWLEAEMSNTPIYGVVTVASPPTLEKNVYKVFRQSPLFVSSAELWKSVLTGQTQITFDHIQILRNEARSYSVSIPTMPEGSPKEEEKKRNAQKYLKAYEEAEKYLWERLKNDAKHLETTEKDLLIKMAIDHFDIPNIVNMCLALLKMDQSFLTTGNSKAFVATALPIGIMVVPVLKISQRFQPQMTITRLVRAALPFDDTKDMIQADRFAFAGDLFKETSAHLHNLAHGSDFEDRLHKEMQLLPIKYALRLEAHRNPKARELEKAIGKIHEEHSVEDEYGYFNLTPTGQILAASETLSSGVRCTLPQPTDKKFLTFSKQTMNDFYRSAHRVHLPSAINTNPVTYLASVYTISVGYSALKGWVSKETAPLVKERAALENLREGRNFIAHGDLFREMNGIDLADVQKSLLTDHLDRCATLSFA
jgi:hypothetical protein